MKNMFAILLSAYVLMACSGKDYFNQGKVAFDKKDYKNAIAYFDSALVENPEDASAFATRGSARYNLKDY